MSSDSIRVVCRLRPLNKIEIANQGEDCVTYTSKDITISVNSYLSYRLEDNRTSITLHFINILVRKHIK